MAGNDFAGVSRIARAKVVEVRWSVRYDRWMTRFRGSIRNTDYETFSIDEA